MDLVVLVDPAPASLDGPRHNLVPVVHHYRLLRATGGSFG